MKEKYGWIISDKFNRMRFEVDRPLTREKAWESVRNFWESLQGTLAEDKPEERQDINDTSDDRYWFIEVIEFSKIPQGRERHELGND